MPELAEVEFYRRQWDPGLGQAVRRVHTHGHARIFRNAPAKAVERGLGGRRFVASQAHGKQMLFQFDGGAWLGLHLGMSGELRTAAADHVPGKHEHLVLALDSVALVFSDYRMFGALDLDLVDDELPPPWWRELPPQPIDPRFTKRHVRDFVRRFPKTPVKTLLLDQRGFPGIGNWMADEICWQLRIPPQTPSGQLADDRIDAIWKETRRVSREAMRVIGTDWGDLPDSWLMNHRWRDGGLCPRRGCRVELVREDLRGRTTCWCPKCQG
jgi:formamidopyrimidine-DNA glycosylase